MHCPFANVTRARSQSRSICHMREMKIKSNRFHWVDMTDKCRYRTHRSANIPFCHVNKLAYGSGVCLLFMRFLTNCQRYDLSQVVYTRQIILLSLSHYIISLSINHACALYKAYVHRCICTKKILDHVYIIRLVPITGFHGNKKLRKTLFDMNKPETVTLGRIVNALLNATKKTHTHLRRMSLKILRTSLNYCARVNV